ncbi:MAG: hypothetical protein AAFY71_21880 [Bacteroidota bacterium]
MDRERIFRRKLLGQLTAEEDVELESLLQQDPSAKEEFESYRETMFAVVAGEKEELKEFLHSLDEPAKTRSLTFQWYAIAATLILLLTLSFLFFRPGNASDLYSEYYESYPNVYLPVTRDYAGQDSLLYTAFLQYESKRYTLAAQSFENYLTRVDTASEVSFYHAMSLMQLEEWDKAAGLLDELKNSGGAKDFEAEIYWYRSLIDLKRKNPSAAKESLNRLLETGSSFKKGEAKQLLEKLN